jgi:SWIM zinc finger
MPSHKWVRKWEVPGSNGGSYVVSVSDDGTWGCSCPRWKFKRVECGHILDVKAENAWRDGDAGTLVSLKVQLVGNYQKKGWTDEKIEKHLTEKRQAKEVAA